MGETVELGAGLLLIVLSIWLLLPPPRDRCEAREEGRGYANHVHLRSHYACSMMITDFSTGCLRRHRMTSRLRSPSEKALVKQRSHDSASSLLLWSRRWRYVWQVNEGAPQRNVRTCRGAISVLMGAVSAVAVGPDSGAG